MWFKRCTTFVQCHITKFLSTEYLVLKGRQVSFYHKLDIWMVFPSLIVQNIQITVYRHQL